MLILVSLFILNKWAFLKSSCAGCAVSGLTPDARTMIERARTEALVSFKYIATSRGGIKADVLPYVELLVYVQRADEGRVSDKGRLQPCHAVRRG